MLPTATGGWIDGDEIEVSFGLGIPEGKGSDEMRSDDSWLGPVETRDGDGETGGLPQPAIRETESIAGAIILRIGESLTRSLGRVGPTGVTRGLLAPARVETYTRRRTSSSLGPARRAAVELPAGRESARSSIDTMSRWADGSQP
jgi:hypothetical protein